MIRTLTVVLSFKNIPRYEHPIKRPGPRRKNTKKRTRLWVWKSSHIWSQETGSHFTVLQAVQHPLELQDSPLPNLWGLHLKIWSPLLLDWLVRGRTKSQTLLVDAPLLGPRLPIGYLLLVKRALFQLWTLFWNSRRRKTLRYFYFDSYPLFPRLPIHCKLI